MADTRIVCSSIICSLTLEFVSDGVMVSRKSSNSFILPKFDRGFDVFRCPRDRFLDLAPFGPIIGSSTCDRKKMDDVKFDDMFAQEEEDEEEDDLMALKC